MNFLQELEKNGDLEKAYFSDISNEDYHSGPGISSSQIKTIFSKSTKHLEKNKKSDSLSFGTAFHDFVNDPSLFSEKYEIVSKCVENSGNKVQINFSDFEIIKNMEKNLTSHPIASKMILNAQREVSFYSRDKVTGVLKKARVDGITSDLKIFDFKTCQSASEVDFVRDAKKYLYRISAAYYLNVVSEVMDTFLNEFYLIACEKQPPYEVAVYKVDTRSIYRADEEIKKTLKKIKEQQLNPSLFKGYNEMKEVLI